MLVLDFADDLLDQILDRDNPVRAGKLVQHDGEVHPLRAHIRQHVERVAGLRHVKGLPHQRGPVAGRRIGLGEIGEHVLDVDHPDHIVQLVAIDRHARMAVIREDRDHLVPAGIGADRHDLAPRHGNVVRVVLAEMEEIAQHLPLDRAEIALRLLFGRILVHALVMAVFVFVDSLFELRTQ